ncbi:MAG: hypothetical protein KDI14_10470 [Halioglobus sp.]|nr:hypothetical protein [Halioglobus sp.]
MNAIGVLIAAIIAILAASTQAAQVDFFWSHTTGSGITGSNEIEADNGDVLTADIVLSPGVRGISSYSISVDFDTDFGNELDFSGAVEFLSAPFIFNLAPGFNAIESTAGTSGHLYSFDAGTFFQGPVIPFTIAQITFVAGATKTDGPDIFSGFFDGLIDGAFDNDGLAISPTFGTASVDSATIPEVPLPAGIWLFVSALMSLGYIRINNVYRFQLRSLVRNSCLSILFCVFVQAAHAAFLEDVDNDGDGIHDGIDNCMSLANPEQFDSDHDGYGNLCDGDLNQDNVTDMKDFVSFLSNFGDRACSTQTGSCNGADFNDDGAVGLADFNIFRRQFNQVPGPSGFTDFRSLDCLDFEVEWFANPPEDTWGTLSDQAKSLGYTTFFEAKYCGSGGNLDGERIVNAQYRSLADNPIYLMYSEPHHLAFLIGVRDEGGSIYVTGSSVLEFDASGVLLPNGSSLLRKPKLESSQALVRNSDIPSANDLKRTETSVPPDACSCADDIRRCELTGGAIALSSCLVAIVPAAAVPGLMNCAIDIAAYAAAAPLCRLSHPDCYTKSCFDQPCEAYQCEQFGGCQKNVAATKILKETQLNCCDDCTDCGVGYCYGTHVKAEPERSCQLTPRGECGTFGQAPPWSRCIGYANYSCATGARMNDLGCIWSHIVPKVSCLCEDPI